MSPEMASKWTPREIGALTLLQLVVLGRDRPPGGAEPIDLSTESGRRAWAALMAEKRRREESW